MIAEPDNLEQRRRIIWLAVACAAMGLLLLLSVAWWQLVPHAEAAAASLAGGRNANVIPAARGGILDSTGQYLVATTVRYRISLSPRLLGEDQKAEMAPQLSAILGMSEAGVAELLQSPREYVPVLREGEDDPLVAVEWPAAVGLQIEGLGSAAFRVEPVFRRVYPDGALAGALLGFVDLEGEAHYGLEEHYDLELQGQSGQWYGVSDVWGRQVLATWGGYRPAVDGKDLVLTLDRNIQHVAERLLAEAMAVNGAESGSLLVLDPRTGAVLAMAQAPGYHPGQYWRVDSAEQYINNMVSAIYEPGSTFKVITMASALESQVVRPTDSYDDRGEVIIGSQRIMNSDRKPHGPTTMTELLAYSRNVGAAHVAAMLGTTRFYEMVRRFGFGGATGIDLAFESPGLMRVPGNTYWHMSDLGTNAFGQGISTTPLQIAVAYAALANDGVLMRPYLVSEIRDGSTGETVRENAPFRVRQVVSPETARQTAEMMADALEMGMEPARLPGYRLAGKSGTAGIADAEGYQGGDFIASFAGFGPLPDPRFVVLVKFDRPQKGEWGVEVAAPVFKQMCQFLVDYYGIPPALG